MNFLIFISIYFTFSKSCTSRFFPNTLGYCDFRENLCEFICKEGFVAVGKSLPVNNEGSSNFLFCDNTHNNITDIVCLPYCPEKFFENTRVKCSAKKNGEKCTFSCTKGYTYNKESLYVKKSASRQSYILCSEGKYLEENVCVPECYVPFLENGSITIQTKTHVKYFCLNGYLPNNDDGTSNCLDKYFLPPIKCIKSCLQLQFNNAKSVCEEIKLGNYCNFECIDGFYAFNKNYISSGKFGKVLCAEDGYIETNVCVKKCKIPQNIDNGELKNKMQAGILVSIGTDVNFLCTSHYSISNTKHDENSLKEGVNTCLSTGLFSREFTCYKLCFQESFLNAITNEDCVDLHNMEYCEFTCLQNYLPFNINDNQNINIRKSNVKCVNGNFETIDICLLQCLTPENIQNGEFIDKSFAGKYVFEQTKISYKCQPNYIPSGYSLNNINENIVFDNICSGNFFKHEFACLKICMPKKFQNTVNGCNYVLDNNFCVLNCATGYFSKLDENPQTIVNLKCVNSAYLYSDVCVQKCHIPISIANGNFNNIQLADRWVNEGTKIDYTCKENYVANNFINAQFYYKSSVSCLNGKLSSQFICQQSCAPKKYLFTENQCERKFNGEYCDFRCNENYFSLNATENKHTGKVLCENGSFLLSEVCTKICEIEHRENILYISERSFSLGKEVVNFICTPMSFLNNLKTASESQCLNGTFDPPLSCSKACLSNPEIKNGKLENCPLAENTKSCQFKCDFSYKTASGGKNIIECKNGIWIENSPCKFYKLPYLIGISIAAFFCVITSVIFYIKYPKRKLQDMNIELNLDHCGKIDGGDFIQFNSDTSLVDPKD